MPAILLSGAAPANPAGNSTAKCNSRKQRSPASAMKQHCRWPGKGCGAQRTLVAAVLGLSWYPERMSHQRKDPGDFRESSDLRHSLGIEPLSFPPEPVISECCCGGPQLEFHFIQKTQGTPALSFFYLQCKLHPINSEAHTRSQYLLNCGRKRWKSLWNLWFSKGKGTALKQTSISFLLWLQSRKQFTWMGNWAPSLAKPKMLR